MSCAEFGTNYTVVYHDETQEDSSPPIMNDNDAVTLHKIKLTHNFGTMHNRSHEAIIRFHKPNKDKNRQDFFGTKLMLYLPWRNENSDILGGYPDYYSRYRSCENTIIRNESKYTANINDLMEYLNDSGPPQHTVIGKINAWLNNCVLFKGLKIDSGFSTGYL